jgi:hypothetical protein
VEHGKHSPMILGDASTVVRASLSDIQQVGGRLDDCGKPLGRSGLDPNVSRLCDGGQSRNQTPVHEDHRVAPVRSCSHVISVRLSLPVDRADQHISEDAPVLGG